jgi:hypothetical protein
MPAKSQVGEFIGYAQPNYKAFRILLRTGNIIISRDVCFDKSASLERATDRVNRVMDTIHLYHHRRTVSYLNDSTYKGAIPAFTTSMNSYSYVPIDNPLFENEDDGQDEAVPELRRSNLQHNPPVYPYNKYLEGNTGVKLAHF